MRVLLTVAGLPDARPRSPSASPRAVGALAGVTAVRVDLGVMCEEQRKAMASMLRGGRAEPEVPFAKPDSLTRVYAIASGKGGVGKSSVTVNLAAAMAAQGLKVGVVDADIYGHSVPRMLGVEQRPTQVENMIMPPSAHGVKVISIGMFTPGNTPVVWRGPMLHRALQQFLADVCWGDLDVLLLDLPPGHRRHRDLGGPAGPQRRDPRRDDPAARRRRGRRAGRVDRPADPPADRRRHREHGLARAARRQPAWTCSARAAVRRSPTALARSTGGDVPLLGQVPLDVRLREGGDDGLPLVLSDPDGARGPGPDAGSPRGSVAARAGWPAGPSGLLPPAAPEPTRDHAQVASPSSRWGAGVAGSAAAPGAEGFLVVAAPSGSSRRTLSRSSVSSSS